MSLPTIDREIEAAVIAHYHFLQNYLPRASTHDQAVYPRIEAFRSSLNSELIGIIPYSHGNATFIFAETLSYDKRLEVDTSKLPDTLPAGFIISETVMTLYGYDRNEEIVSISVGNKVMTKNISTPKTYMSVSVDFVSFFKKGIEIHDLDEQLKKYYITLIISNHGLKIREMEQERSKLAFIA